MTMKQSVPEVLAIRAAKVYPTPKRLGSYEVQVHCPYCSAVHIHSWAGPGDEGGHRVPDCWTPAARKINSAGYTIVIPADLEVSTTP